MKKVRKEMMKLADFEIPTIPPSIRGTVGISKEWEKMF